MRDSMKLEASSSAHYMRGMAHKALNAGFNAVLLNQRNCGGTEHLTPSLYHSGLTEDARQVIGELTSGDGLTSIVVAGYSLGGNLALKLAGEQDAAPLPSLKAACAVSPIMEIAACVDALERRSNLIYQWNFVRNLKARMRRKARAHPGRFRLDTLGRIRTVREFDEAYTAPHFGFRDASDYYHRAAAMRVIDRIRIPTLIVTAADDPFVPHETFDDPAIANNPSIQLIVTRYGGHCGFLGMSTGRGDDGYWAETMVVDFAARHAHDTSLVSAAAKSGPLPSSSCLKYT